MENKNAARKPLPRIGLSAPCREIVQGWQKQLRENFPGFQASDGDLVSWALSKHGPILTEEESTELQKLFFDEVKRLEWLLAQAKAAKGGAGERSYRKDFQ